MGWMVCGMGGGAENGAENSLQLGNFYACVWLGRSKRPLSMGHLHTFEFTNVSQWYHLFLSASWKMSFFQLTFWEDLAVCMGSDTASTPRSPSVKM